MFVVILKQEFKVFKVITMIARIQRELLYDSTDNTLTHSLKI